MQQSCKIFVAAKHLKNRTHRCRAPEYLIPIINIIEEFKQVFLFKFNIVLIQDFKIFFFEWLFFVMFFLG